MKKINKLIALATLATSTLYTSGCQVMGIDPGLRIPTKEHDLNILGVYAGIRILNTLENKQLKDIEIEETGLPKILNNGFRLGLEPGLTFTRNDGKETTLLGAFCGIKILYTGPNENERYQTIK
jgi:hypothetical protein